MEKKQQKQKSVGNEKKKIKEFLLTNPMSTVLNFDYDKNLGLFFVLVNHFCAETEKNCLRVEKYSILKFGVRLGTSPVMIFEEKKKINPREFSKERNAEIVSINGTNSIFVEFGIKIYKIGKLDLKIQNIIVIDGLQIIFKSKNKNLLYLIFIKDGILFFYIDILYFEIRNCNLKKVKEFKICNNIHFDDLLNISISGDSLKKFKWYLTINYHEKASIVTSLESILDHKFHKINLNKGIIIFNKI